MTFFHVSPSRLTCSVESGHGTEPAATFLPAYIEKGILSEDPFASLDQSGVGELIAMGTQRGRQANEGIERLVRKRPDAAGMERWVVGHGAIIRRVPLRFGDFCT